MTPPALGWAVILTPVAPIALLFGLGFARAALGRGPAGLRLVGGLFLFFGATGCASLASAAWWFFFPHGDIMPVPSEPTTAPNPVGWVSAAKPTAER